ncbi:MAG TPA: capsule assembly Wzi family protein [Gemmatimonadaceae bacterium]|nr:capsule assembly Wzi family protein [Gemmatimonadaceae bacterium]
MIRRALIALAVTAQLASAQATSFVPPDARVYDDIARLSASGLIDTMVVSVRPYSRREVVRLLREAQRNLSRLSRADWATATIASDLAIYDRPANRPIDWVRAEATELSSPGRAIPAQPTGSIDAQINPLAADRLGRPIADGTSGTIETMHRAELGRHLALSFNPLLYAAAPRGGNATERLRIQSGEVDALFGNLHLDAGRGYALFGEAEDGGLALSTNQPGLDLVRVSTDKPAALPSPFRALGRWRAMLFVADMGKHQHFPYSQLFGGTVAVQPTANLEFGLHEVNEMGGRGSPPASFGDRVLDVLIVPDQFRLNSDFQFSNKMFGGDFRVRVPSWHGFEVYAEGLLDDWDRRRAKSSFLDDGGGIAGFDFTCIVECGRMRLRAEYRQTGIRFYTHTQFASGIAVDSLILGDELGPRATAGYLTLDLDQARLGTFSLQGALEVRSGNVYAGGASGPHDVNFHFVRVETHPAEKRLRGLLVWRSARDERVDLRAAAGLEHAENYGFVGGETKLNGIAQVGVEVRP